MNNIKTDYIGGFPLKLDDFRFGHDAVLEAFRGIMSTYGIDNSTAVILKGCARSSAAGTTSIAEGYVSIGGEICFVPAHSYPDPSGGEQEYWILESTFDVAGLKQFQNLTNNDTYEVRVGKVTKAVGVPSGHTIYSSTKTIFQIISENISVVPSGIISMWSGAIGAIPSGYLLCDGTSGTPDLRSRFIIGYDPTNSANDAIGEIGGNDEITLSTGQLPSHSHTATFAGNALPNHSHGIPLQNTPGGGGNVSEANGTNNLTASTNGASAGTPSGTVTVNATGSGDPINIRPKYYTMAFIMKV
jgi:microcystin-dependent protein